MKNYKFGIILGVLSILSSLTFVGIPVGFNNIIETISTVFYVVGLLVIICLGFVGKNDKTTIITTVIYTIILFALVLIIELNYKDYILLEIGFIPGLIMSILGIIKTLKVKSENKTTASFIFNIIGLVLSIASLSLAILDGRLII